MNRLYRLSNGKNGAWVVAPDEDTAKAVFKKAGFVKDLKNVKRVHDQTDFYLNPENAGGDERAHTIQTLRDMLASSKLGIACIENVGGAMLGSDLIDVLTGKKERPKSVSSWVCGEVVL